MFFDVCIMPYMIWYMRYVLICLMNVNTLSATNYKYIIKLFFVYIIFWKLKCKFQNCNFQNRNKLLFASVSISVAWLMTLQNSTDYMKPIQGYNVKKQSFGQKDNFPFSASYWLILQMILYLTGLLQKILFNIKVTKIMICFVKLFLMYHQYFCHIQMCISFARLYYSNTPDLREKAETLSPSWF